eukprot:364664-Chlamydomonas_euryale.AAC.3
MMHACHARQVTDLAPRPALVGGLAPTYGVGTSKAYGSIYVPLSSRTGRGRPFLVSKCGRSWR